MTNQSSLQRSVIDARDPKDKEAIALLQSQQDEDAIYCPVCESGDAVVLGKVGNRIFLMCGECCRMFSGIR